MSNYHYEVTTLPVDETLFYRRADDVQRLRYLLRYAQLAPSNYNTQPWKFRVTRNQIWIYADIDRWLKISDSDKRELHISLGCCIENLLIAARHYNFKSSVEYLPDRMQPDLAAVVYLKQRGPTEHKPDSGLMLAIPKRRTNRRNYAADPLQASHWALIESCATDGVTIVSAGKRNDLRDKVAQLIPLAYQVSHNDKAYLQERKITRRYQPPATMDTIRRSVLSTFGIYDSYLSKQDCAKLKNSPGLIMLGVADDTHENQLKVGRVFQRISLIATSLQIAIHPIGQVLSVPELRDELRHNLRLESYPMMICRLGYSEAKIKQPPMRRLQDILR